MIVAEEATEPLAAIDVTTRPRRGEAFRRNQAIVDALVIPFLMVVIDERRERSTQVRFSQDDDPIQAFLFDRPDETFRVRVAVGRLKRRLHDTNAAVSQGLAERGAPFRVPVADEDPVATEHTVIR